LRVLRAGKPRTRHRTKMHIPNEHQLFIVANWCRTTIIIHH
jgi:hypothetical protein